jgi:hypothetical protein
LGIAAVLIATKDLSARGLWRCSARATSSLPLPESPVISTVACDMARRPMARKTSCIAGACPRISGTSPLPRMHRLVHRFVNRSLDQLDRLIDIEGFGQVLEGAALKCGNRAFQIGIGGHDDDRHRREAVLTSCSKLQPGLAGHADVGQQDLRRLAPCSSCEMASLAEAKLLNEMPSRDRVFSRTQRMERSSSTIQTGFIFFGSSVVAMSNKASKSQACSYRQADA